MWFACWTFFFRSRSCEWKLEGMEGRMGTLQERMRKIKICMIVSRGFVFTPRREGKAVWIGARDEKIQGIQWGERETERAAESERERRVRERERKTWEREGVGTESEVNAACGACCGITAENIVRTCEKTLIKGEERKCKDDDEQTETPMFPKLGGSFRQKDVIFSHCRL